jgi:hypothetical protein
MLSAMARWTVPTVVTIALSARVLEAKASCPPCQRKTGGRCRACTTGQILNCQCEPCLGPPYCSSSLMVSPSMQGLQAAPAAGTPGAAAQPANRSLYDALRARPQQGAPSPFRQPLYRDPFGVEKAKGPLAPGLYQRLRPDTGFGWRRP